MYLLIHAFSIKLNKFWHTQQLKQHKCVIQELRWVRWPGRDSLGLLLRVSPGRSECVGETCVLLWAWGVSSKLFQVVVWIQFFEAVGLRFCCFVGSWQGFALSSYKLPSILLISPSQNTTARRRISLASHLSTQFPKSESLIM